MTKVSFKRLPPWFKQDIPDDKALSLMRLFSASGVNTVCRFAKCPNISGCFGNNEFTFMILGNACTRNCRFCNVNKAGSAGGIVDAGEPRRISGLVKSLGLSYVVITSVTRDDLSDGGASVFAKTIELIHGVDKNIKVEVLIPDFQAKALSLKCVLDAFPFVVGHNIETVKRLYTDLRPQADYRRSLWVLKKIKELSPRTITKSSLMLGLGETKEEVIEAMRDLKSSECDCLTLGQYLAPSERHYPVKEFVAIEQFREYQDVAADIGFRAVMSGPKVRSSYDAQKMQKEFSLCMT